MKLPTLKTIALLAALCCLLASPAPAADFFLRAGATTKTMPDGRVVPMWGFALDTAFGANNGAITVPGPVLVVPPGDSVLNIHLDNNLSVPISLIIHGQITTTTPVRNPDGRVRSFTHETAPGNGSAVTYTWPNVKPGTFLYQSGTHPQVQVPMGLYGAMKKDTNTLVAYPGVPYATDVTLLYSEIDPELNDAVAANDFGAGQSMTSTIDYEAKYFLINGAPFTNGTPPIPVGLSNTRILLRFLNAGLEARMPVVAGYYLDEVAEDGNLHPFAKRQFALHLPPAKTLDALFTPTACNLVAVYDRRLGLVNNTNSPGGMLAYLGFSGPLGLGCAASAGQAEVPYNSALVAGCGTPPYTFSIISGALPNGLTLNSASGEIIGTPTTAGTYNYVAQVTDLLGGSATASCSITIAPGSLIGKWKFDESSGTIAADSSGLGNHGRLTNGPVFGPGRVGNSLTFDGSNDYVFVPDNNALEFNGMNFTLALWVKTTRTSNQALVEKQHSGFTGMFLFALNRDNLSTTRGGFSVWTGNQWLDSNFKGVTNGLWQHLAVTYDGTAFRLYRDGILDRTITSGNAYVATTSPLNFGRFGTANTGWPFQGMLDEICKLNRALTDSEILALASATPPPLLPTVTITASDASASETGPDPGTFTVSRTGSTASNLTVNYTLSGTASNGTDYALLSNSVTLQAGASSTNLTVAPVDDAVFEGNETVIATLASSPNYTVGSPNNATVTIADNEAPPAPLPTVTITAPDPSASETGPDPGTFTISRTGSTASNLTVNYTISGTASNGTDYALLTNSVTFGVGASSTNRTVTPVDDAVVEGNETVIATLASSPNYTVGSPSTATVTIADNDTSSIPAGVVGYWKLDDGSGTTAADSSGNGNLGRLTNGAAFNATGRVNGSLTLDGVNDFAFVPDAEVLDFNARNFTVALWVKTTNTVNQALVEKQHSSFTGMFLFALNRDNLSSSRGKFSVWTGSAWQDSVFAGMNDGAWHHVAISFDGTRFRFYHNGALDRNTAASASYANTTLPLNFGRFGSMNTGWPLRGMLDEIYKFNRALSDAEIAGLAGVP